MTVTVLLVDDHPMIRQGLRNLLSEIPEFQIVGEASNGIEAIDKIGLLKPDILVMDMMMPDLNGLEVLGQVKGLSRQRIPLYFQCKAQNPMWRRRFEAALKVIS